MSKPKAKVYIDGANVFYAQRKMGWVLGWEKVKAFLAETYDVVEYRYYQGIKSGDENMASYLKYLDAIHCTVLTKPVKKIKIDHNHPLNRLYQYTEMYKCNFDVEMTADMIFDRASIDEYILFSGDSDFDYVVKRLRDVGKRVTVYSSRKVLSWELKFAVNRYEILEKYRSQFAK